MKFVTLRLLLLPLLLIISLKSTAQNQLIGRWIFVAETYSENLIQAYGPLGDEINTDSLKNKIIQNKLQALGSYSLDFRKNDLCESQNVSFKYSINGDNLLLKFINHKIGSLTENELQFCEVGSGTCKVFYKESYFKSLTRDQLKEKLNINHYDSLLMHYILERNNLNNRKNLFKTDSPPQNSLTQQEIDTIFIKYFGKNYASSSDTDAIEYSLSFVIEPDGTATGIALDVLESKKYEAFVDAFRELGDRWKPFKKEGEAVAVKVHMPIHLKNF